MVNYIDSLNENMINTIKEYGVNNELIFNAMRKHKRHLFLDNDIDLKLAYSDNALLISNNQTISQPYTVALMLNLLDLKKGDNVLEIGTGSMWNAVLIKEIVKNGKVTTIEYEKNSIDKLKKLIKDKNFDIELVHGDGAFGYKKNAPYDKIIVTCAIKEIFTELINQLNDFGIIVAPVGKNFQKMTKLIKKDDKINIENHGFFNFILMKGEKGFD
ncbi:MAG: protein-L-isoaspartate O-methyltransferase family protein [Candidatus Woesearchaeota archaeon]